MAFDYLGVGALDYFPCRYGASKLLFRGPKISTSGKYCVAIGGSETFGKFVEQPYPELLANLTDRRVINLGCMYAGAEVFLNDPSVMEICNNAELTVVQLTGAQNMSNRFYSVHPRRNDRFLGGTSLLYTVFQELDFTDVHFTGHLLSKLQKTSASRFQMVRDELQSEWVCNMKSLLDGIGGKVVLLWLADHRPGDSQQKGRGLETMLLEPDMIDQLVDHHDGLVEIVATPDEITAGHDRMVFSMLEEPAARQMLGPIAHQEAARQLQPFLDRL